MKKSLILFFVLICAALSVLSVSAAPRERYYDQDGNSYWCNKDSYGCWITSENGAHEYIMFWSEAARDYIMGPDSNAPIAEVYGYSALPLRDPSAATPEPESSASEDESPSPSPSDERTDEEKEYQEMIDRGCIESCDPKNPTDCYWSCPGG